MNDDSIFFLLQSTASIRETSTVTCFVDVDTSLKPLFSKKKKKKKSSNVTSVPSVFTVKCLDVIKEGPAAICNLSLGEKENMHYNLLWVYWMNYVKFMSGTTVALTLNGCPGKCSLSVPRAVQ